MAGRIQKGERRVLNGKTVFADGNGNWTSGYSIFNLKAGGKKVGTYDTSVDPRQGDFAELNGERVIADGKGSWITPYSNRPGTTKGGQVRGSYGDAPSQPYRHNSNYTNKEVRDNKAAVDAMTAKMRKEQPELFEQQTEDKDPVVDNSPSNRNDQRTNELGVQQTGTNMGKISMPGLAELERYAGGSIADFSGPSFPTQPQTNRITDGYPNTSNQQLQGITEEERGQMRDAGLMTAGDLDGFKPGGKFSGAPTATDGIGVGSATIAGGKNEGKTVNVNDADYEAYVSGNKAVPGGSGGGLQAALSDSDGINSYMSKFRSNSPENEELRRRSAFLDADDSLAGSRAVNRGLGGVRVGGDIVVNNGGTPTKIDSDTWREIRNAGPGEAQALKNKWVQALKTNKADEPQVPSSAQNPTVESGTSSFVTDPKADIQGVGKSVDYSNNNANDTQIADRGGTSIPEAYNDDDERYSSFKPQDFYIK